ncbi:autophagocytosis associated protein [Paraphysoderma sedebokerense]|nr:autophagocytosis associated protein [Paraphysoderma sedebokerense]
MSSLHSIFHNIREYLSPVLANSKFLETGVLTPEEFVAAGDYLVFKCPTWSWESGDPSKRRDYLPPNKQYLVTKNVPCAKRVKQMEYTDDATEANIEDAEDGESWGVQAVAEVKAEAKNEPEDDEEEIPDIDDIPDMEDDFGVEEEEDPAVLEQQAHTKPGSLTKGGGNDKILRTRTYDLSITYDKYYQTPRIWLFGYDENRNPLTSTQIFEDISQDHAHKTVTIEGHPHVDMSLASIHPCRHASVMKRIMEKMKESGKELRVDQYLVLFLKFMSCVLPTIDYDHTMTLE